jgi:hypothetical protein
MGRWARRPSAHQWTRMGLNVGSCPPRAPAQPPRCRARVARDIRGLRFLRRGRIPRLDGHRIEAHVADGRTPGVSMHHGAVDGTRKTALREGAGERGLGRHVGDGLPPAQPTRKRDRPQEAHERGGGGTFHAALARNASARGRRPCGLRPLPRYMCDPMCRASPEASAALTNSASRAERGPDPPRCTE